MVWASAVANVMTTGTFTIPLMRRIGYRPAFAGAVEAVASTGGQIMPPIMGAAAFVMPSSGAPPTCPIAAPTDDVAGDRCLSQRCRDQLPCWPIAATARRFSSSGDSSSLRVAMCQTWPNGSSKLPVRSP